jgi:hypothetical protein
MDSEFLEEYEIREVDSLKRNIPLSERIEKLRSPIFNLVEESSSFWSQVAFSGTLIFPLRPISQESFETKWNFSISQIPNFIQFVKETKKIQFVLTDHPKFYKECDYLEPIFREFSPPIYSSTLDITDKKVEELRLVCFDELDHLISLLPQWKNQSTTLEGKLMLGNHAKSYVQLRYYGFDEIADTFIENFLIDPNFSHIYLSIVEKMILYPMGDSLKGNLSISLDTIKKINQLGIDSQISSKKASFPEVGSYLMKKCTYYPESLESCKNLISQYADNDLYAVNAALNEAIIDRNNSGILQKKNEVGEILDNIWDDNIVKSNATMFRHGIDITCGTIGYFVGDSSGLLGKIGVEILNSTKSKYVDQFTELISKKVASPYMATIYDFKKKYRKEI